MLYNLINANGMTTIMYLDICKSTTKSTHKSLITLCKSTHQERIKSLRKNESFIPFNTIVHSHLSMAFSFSNLFFFSQREVVSIVSAWILQRDGDVHFLWVQNDRALDSFVKFGLHQVAQYVSPGPNREIHS